MVKLIREIIVKRHRPLIPREGMPASAIAGEDAPLARPAPRGQLVKTIQGAQGFEPPRRPPGQRLGQLERGFDPPLDVEIVAQKSLGEGQLRARPEHLAQRAGVLEHQGGRPRVIVRPDRAVPQADREFAQRRIMKQLVKEPDGGFNFFGICGWSDHGECGEAGTETVVHPEFPARKRFPSGGTSLPRILTTSPDFPYMSRFSLPTPPAISGRTRIPSLP